MTDSAANEIHAEPGTLRRAWWLAVALAMLITALYALAGSATTLFDRDEPRFAQATVEMIASGNWLYPTFDGALRPDKPILIYWLMSVPVRWFGVSSFALRLPSALGIGIAALATFVAGRRLMSERAALLAMLVLVSTPLTMMIGTAATADGWLLGMTTASIASFVCMITSKRRSEVILWVVFLAGFCGLAQLTKGPVALAIVGFASLGMLLIGWRRVANARRWLMPVIFALLVSIGIFLVWALQANAATQGAFAEQGLGKHVLGRILAPMEGHGGNWFLTLPYYIPVLLVGFFPWTLLLPATVVSLMRTHVGDDASPRVRVLRVLALAWVVPTFVMMSLVATKLPHYVLPIWPALALVVARAAEPGVTLSARWLKVGFVTFVISGALGVLGLFVASASIDDISILAAGALAALLLGLTVLMGAMFERMARFKACIIALAAGMLITQQQIALRLLPSFEPYKLAPRVAEAIKQRVPEQTNVMAVGFGEPTLVFSLWPTRVQVSGSPESIDSWRLATGPSVLVALHDDALAHGLDSANLRDRFELIARIEGFNYSNGKWLTLEIIGRDLPGARSPNPAQRSDL